MDAALQHLQWTLRYDWEGLGSVAPRARGGQLVWHDGQQLGSARSAMEGADPWLALLCARQTLGLSLHFRRTPAHCRGRSYGWRDGLGERLIQRLRRLHRAGCAVAAVRAYLDIAHVHPFEDGNARSAVLLADWMLGARLDLGWDGVLRIPKPPGEDRVPVLMLQALR